MFGHNKSDDEQTTAQSGDVQAPTMAKDDATASQQDPAVSIPTPGFASATPMAAQMDEQQAQTPQADTSLDASDMASTPTPAVDDDAASTSAPVNPPPAPDVPTPVAVDDDDVPAPAADSGDDTTSAPAVDKDKLANMKQQALDHLEPLADNLSQSPEEEFRTTMMRIQANDNHTLLEKALEAAKKITDDNARAQAMLDIINEINYFSQDEEV